jgi:D-alanine---D-serine ligase
MKIILILYGGCSSEYGVSLQSAQAVLEHLNPRRWQALPVHITRTGQWTCEGLPCVLRLDRGHAALLLADGRTLAFDGAFPVLHGKNGEDGTVQGLLEMAGVPVIGCGTLSSALCMDKDRAHKLAALTGVRVPRGKVFIGDGVPAKLESCARELGFPLFVKPVRAGSSFGISRVTRAEELAEAVSAAFDHDREVLLEEAVPGFEVGCAVLGDPPALTVGAVDEIELSGGFFDFDEKYSLKTSAIHCPARIPPEKAREIQEAAKTVYTALDCRGFARADFFLTPAGEVVFNEVNTIPGFTAHSRYPSMMKAIGLDFTALLDRLIELGVGE